MAALFGDDTVIVPANVAEESVGFSLDAGGSTVKLAYRDKRDYNKGKPINAQIPADSGLLKLVHFRSSEVDEVIAFLESNCDIKNDCANRKAYSTGMYSFQWHEKLKNKFNIRLNTQTEFDFFIKAFRYLFHSRPRHTLVYPEHEQGIQEGKAYLSALTGTNEISKEHSDAGMFQSPDNTESEEDLETCDITPCLITQMGSCIVYHKVEADWSFNMVDYTFFGGRSFLGVSTGICGGVQLFDKLMELANSGSTRRMDVHVSDVRQEETTDLYGAFPADLPYFQFGAMSFTDPAEFSLEDKVAGWVNLACAHYAQYTHLMALHHGADRVFMTGGFCDNDTIRRYITKFWNSRNVLFNRGKKKNIYFVKNARYLGAIGAIMKEVEDLSSPSK